MTKITIPDTADLLAAREEAYARGYHDAQERGITSGHFVIQDSPELAALRARVAELEAAIKEAALSELAAHGQAAEAHADAIRLRAALNEIIMEATSRNHAIDIARRARAEGGE